MTPNVELTCSRPRRKWPASPATQQAGCLVQLHVRRRRRTSMVAPSKLPRNVSMARLTRRIEEREHRWRAHAPRIDLE
jgi:hypothetical protein